MRIAWMVVLRDISRLGWIPKYLYFMTPIFLPYNKVIVVQSPSSVLLFVTPLTAACRASLSFTTSRSLLKLMSIESMMPANHLILCHLLVLLPSISQHQGLFTWVSYLHQVAKVLELQLQHLSFQSSFRTDFLQEGLVRSPCSPRDSQESSPTPQFKSINSSVLCLFYDSTLTSILEYWKNYGFDYMTFLGKSDVSLCFFNMLSRLVIAFIPRCKCILISWLQSPSAVILEPKKIKSVTVSIVSPSVCHEEMGPDAMMFVFWMLSFSLSSFTFIKRIFSSPLPSALRMVSLTVKSLWCKNFLIMGNFF